MRLLPPSNQHQEPPTTTLIVGLGNPLRGDDGIGPEVVRRLRRRLGGDASVRLVESAGADLMELLGREGCGRVVVIDAASMGREPGEWIRHPVATPAVRPDPEALALAHGLGLAEAVLLLSSLGVRLPPIVVYAVQLGQLGWGEGLTPAVRRAAGPVAEAVFQEVTGLARSRNVLTLTKDVRACRQAPTRSMEERGGVPWRRSS